ncbi:NAD(P)H-dependent oxidoreductase [Microcoleus sp. A2-C5]|uniref:NAD(P)H-dependent oxidoreductase n=1 Tax=unclassified Microcoleus TaxID=2642155 RepID=UPI002FD1358C
MPTRRQVILAIATLAALIGGGTMPALMKGFFNRTLLPNFAFKYRQDSPMWDKLLANSTAQLLVTMDTPSWFYRWVFKMPGHEQMKRTILGFCDRYTTCGMVRSVVGA